MSTRAMTGQARSTSVLHSYNKYFIVSVSLCVLWGAWRLERFVGLEMMALAVTSLDVPLLKAFHSIFQYHIMIPLSFRPRAGLIPHSVNLTNMPDPG